MFKQIIAAAAIVCVPVGASAVTVGFDVDDDGVAIPANTPITNQYADFGVLFAGFEDGAPVDVNAAPDPDGNPQPSSPNSLTNCDDAGLSCPGNRADVVEISFGTGVHSVSVMVNTLGNDTVTFNAFDTLGGFLETQAIAGTMDYELLSFMSSGIGSIEVLQPNDSWAYALDDLMFEPVAAVSAPGTLGLLGAGLVVTALASRRRHS